MPASRRTVPRKRTTPAPKGHENPGKRNLLSGGGARGITKLDVYRQLERLDRDGLDYLEEYKKLLDERYPEPEIAPPPPSGDALKAWALVFYGVRLWDLADNAAEVARRSSSPEKEELVRQLLASPLGLTNRQAHRQAAAQLHRRARLLRREAVSYSRQLGTLPNLGPPEQAARVALWRHRLAGLDELKLAKQSLRATF
jgi:hypothetical protein